MIEGEIKEKEKGFVGAVTRVNTMVLDALLESGFIPVISPIGMNSAKQDDEPATLNYNADVIAGEIAAALNAEMLIFLTDVDGVSDSDGKVLPKLTANEAKALIKSGVASGGMIPKINACLKALTVKASARIIDGRQSHALLKGLKGSKNGTTIQ